MQQLNNEFIIESIFSDTYDYREVRHSIEHLQTNEKSLLVTSLSGMLIKEDSAILRNRIAIILMDINDRSCLHALAVSINNPKTKGSRGTLIYAMQNFNPLEYLYELVVAVISDTLEASDNALDIIEELDGDIDEEIFEKCKIYINESLKNCTQEKKEKIQYLKDIFDSNE